MTNDDTIQVRIPRELWERIKALAEEETQATGLKRSPTAQTVALIKWAILARGR